jgi:hypothetical protein
MLIRMQKIFYEGNFAYKVYHVSGRYWKSKKGNMMSSWKKRLQKNT